MSFDCLGVEFFHVLSVFFENAKVKGRAGKILRFIHMVSFQFKKIQTDFRMYEKRSRIFKVHGILV